MKKILDKKFAQQNVSEISQKHLEKKWARRAPLFAAEACSSPQELEKSRP